MMIDITICYGQDKTVKIAAYDATSGAIPPQYAVEVMNN
jgi:hypothetical protein